MIKLEYICKMSHKGFDNKQKDKHIRILNWMGWMMVIICWSMVFVHYAQLPAIIPTHFNGSGQADGFSQKSIIYLMPTVLTVLYTGLTVLNRYPQLFYYPTEIIPENKLWQYQNAQLLIATINLALSVIFSLITFYTMRAAVLHEQFIPVWLLPLVLLLIFTPVIFFLIRSGKK